MSNFMKIRPVGTELYLAGRRTDGQTDTMKLIVAFGSAANAPSKLEAPVLLWLSALI